MPHLIGLRDSPRRWGLMDTASTFYFPDPEHQRTFATYSNYFESLANALRGEYGEPAWRGVAEFTKQSHQAARIERRGGKAPEEIVSALRLSWALEFQIHVSGWVMDEAIAYLLPASFTNAYYSVYHSMRALFAAMGQNVPRSHTGGLNAIANIVSRGVLPVPWSVMCDRCGVDRDCYPGLPDEAELTDHHSLATPTFEARWTNLCRLLRTTREREIQRHYEEELKALRKSEPWRVRLGPGARDRIDERLRPTTLFDVLWRMRTRSHYQDVEAFLRGISTGTEARRFHENLQCFVTACLAVLEVVIVRYRGIDLVREASEPLGKGDRADVFNEGIGQRIGVL